jgi:type IV secretion system protein VirD4
MAKGPRRILGLTFDGRPLFEPNPKASHLIYAAMGGGKTTSVAVPAVECLLADHGQGLFINDVKDGEIAHQIGEMCIRHGRKFGVVDDFEVLPRDYPYRISLNPLGAAQTALEESPWHLPFVIEAITHTLIEEPPNDQRNLYWRESPREFIEFAAKILLAHNSRLATPGGLYALLADPHVWQSALDGEAEDEESELRDDARRLLDLKASNPEHYTQHLRAALSALKIFSFGALQEAGRNAEFTHADLIRDKWVVCFVNPLRYADRLGSYFALHYLSLLNAQLSGRFGRTCFILDEFCNAPLRAVVNGITGFRAYGLRCLYITQSRQDAVRKYGERETAVLEENCALKQWLKFSDFEEAERVSKAMGESINVSQGLGFSSDRETVSGNLSIGKDRLFTPYELMSLSDDEQIIHVAGVGFIHCRKIRQNQIAPYCFELAPNPLEGGRLPPDPKVALDPTPWGAP